MEGIDPEASLQLKELLRLSLTPDFPTEMLAMMMEEVLSSWRPRDKMPVLQFHPEPTRSSEFTRGGLAEVLRAVGAMTERLLRPIQETTRACASEDTDTRTQCAVVVTLWDWEWEADWWWDHVQSCFPTWALKGTIFMDFRSLKPIRE